MEEVKQTVIEIDNLIIGGGPAGLQLGYFFKKYKIKYLILEREDKCGSFFDKFPHSRKLISINKVHTGSENKDFNLRHDWNSLLNDEDLLFKKYSKEFYPDAEDLVKYLNDFCETNKLNIKLNTNVSKVVKTENGYSVECSDGITYNCKKLIAATGLSLPNLPKFADAPKNVKHYYDFEKNYFTKPENLEKYNNKKVAIIGGGNAGFELANILNNHCSHIHILGAGKDYAMTSHYAGDLRSVYMPFLDSFFLKSLNCYTKEKHKIDNQSMVIQKNKDDKYSILDARSGSFMFASPSLNFYDEIIYCTGWKFNDSIFNFEIQKTENKKYPLLFGNYQSVNNENLFFIGSLMHTFDNKQSSGGFIHGFRYLIELFVKINYDVPFKKTEIEFKGNLSCYEELNKKIISRINTASSLYQMYGVIQDIFYYDKINKKIVYVEDLTETYLLCYLKQHNIRGFSQLVLKYSNNKIYDLNTHDDFKPKDPIFLHLEIFSYAIEESKDKKYQYDQNMVSYAIFPDDLTADFSSDEFKTRIGRFIFSCNLVF